MAPRHRSAVVMLLVQKDPKYGSLVRPTVEAGRGPGAPDPVPDPDPVAKRRTTRHSERQARGTQDQPPSVSGEDPPAERPRRLRRAQENLPDWARPDSPDGADGEDVGQSSRQRICRPPSPPPPTARPAVDRRQLRRLPAEAPSRPPPLATVESEEEDEPKRKVRKDALPKGDYLVKWTTVEDKVRYIRWGPSAPRISREAIASITDWMIWESGLDRALCRPMHKPHLAACMEFVRSFDEKQGTGTVRGEVIRIDAELIEQMFGIPPGMDPLSFTMSIPHGVSAHLLMYLQARFGTGGQKRTTKYNIASFIAGSISRETKWVKNHLKVTHPQRYCETFVGIPLTLIFLHCGVITEAECETAFDIPETGWDIPAVVPADDADKERDLPGADGGISDGGDAGAHIPESRGADLAPQAVDDSVLATLRAEVQRITQEKDAMATELARLQSQSRWQRQSLLDPGETRVKTLVLDIFDLLVHVITNKRDRQMAETMGYVVYRMEVGERPPSYIVRGNILEVLGTCMEMAHCVIWTSKGRTFTMSVIMDLDRRGLLPTGVASELLCTIWCYDECFRTRSSAADSSVKHISMKDFKRFLDSCVCTRDILLVDTVVAANSLNHPYNAVHPPQFVQHLPRVGQDEFVMDRLLSWLRRWAHDTSPTTLWVELYRRDVDGADPLAGLRRREILTVQEMTLPPAPEAEDPTPEAEDPTLEPEEPTREPDEPTREPAVLAEESARVLPSVQDRPRVGLGRPTLGVPCSRRLPLFEYTSVIQACISVLFDSVAFCHTAT
ncbi:hypothetical protein R1sor_012847 [Riccia sorocarpa]|uniref:FCP1 homology domain-containing protein n=1 Tax=Riccia sorocarpa TaxID=122646 RepID=A0ABD3I911_9MARC